MVMRVMVMQRHVAREVRRTDPVLSTRPWCRRHGRMTRAALSLLAVLLASCTCREPGADKKTEAELKPGCAANQADACVALGDLYAQPDTKLDGPLLPTRKKACALSSASGCRKLGELLRDGDYPHRVNVDASAATAAFERACKLGDAVSCLTFGDRAEGGHGANVDVQAAAEAYLRGCELGEKTACEAIARLLEQKKSGLSAQLYGRACDAGVRSGCAP
jgi:hypothetical protein